MIRSINPATGLERASFRVTDAAEIESALQRAVRTQSDWADTAIAVRAGLLGKIAEHLRGNARQLADLITAEMGKPILEAEAEVEKCAVTCDFYAENAEAFLADEPVLSGATESYVTYEPMGVVLALMPWNFPFFQVFRFAAPAIASGNAVLLKHAENVPDCARAIEKIFYDSGAPDGLFKSLLIGPGPIQGLIADPRVAAVTFTGSSRVGSIIGSQAGSEIKKQVLELGGSDPFIVLADADIDAAAATAVRARNLNAGQSCISAKRFILEASIAGRFTDAFVTGVEQLAVGDPTLRTTQIGPMAREDLRAAIHRQVEVSKGQGARVLTGGSLPDGPGFFYPPTVLADVTPDMAVFREETFGPAAALIRAQDLDHVVALANDTEYGLGCALWTTDTDRAKRLVPKINSGSVFINGMVASDPRLPFGGVKKSGYGRELGVHGMREFTHIRTVWVGPSRTPSVLQLSE